MLSRLEEVFLAILRFAIVAVAGIVLLIALGGLVGGAVQFGRATFTSSGAVFGGDLSRFIQERRLASEVERSAAAPIGNAAAPREPTAVSGAVGHAATVFTTYLNRARRNTVTKAELITALNGHWLSIPADHSDAYDASLRRLADQIATSRGQPLSRVRVIELLEWHRGTILAEADRQRQAEESAMASAWLWLARASQAFLLFIAIAFYFLLVRVERHLRLLRVQHVEARSETDVSKT